MWHYIKLDNEIIIRFEDFKKCILNSLNYNDSIESVKNSLRLKYDRELSYLNLHYELENAKKLIQVNEIEFKVKKLFNDRKKNPSLYHKKIKMKKELLDNNLKKEKKKKHLKRRKRKSLKYPIETSKSVKAISTPMGGMTK